MLRSYSNCLIIFCSILVFLSCSKSDDQRKFENEAFSQPDGYTATQDGINITNSDPDDWRIGPMFRGRINLGSGLGSPEPPHPNPLGFNQNLTLNIYINSSDVINRLEVWKFENPSDLTGPFATRIDFSAPGLVTFTLNGQDISGSTGGSQASGLYRLLIYDGNQNLITYGDIRIE